MLKRDRLDGLVLQRKTSVKNECYIERQDWGSCVTERDRLEEGVLRRLTYFWEECYRERWARGMSVIGRDIL